VVLPVEVHSGYNADGNTDETTKVGIRYAALCFDNEAVGPDYWFMIDESQVGLENLYETPEAALEAGERERKEIDDRYEQQEAERAVRLATAPQWGKTSTRIVALQGGPGNGKRLTLSMDCATLNIPTPFDGVVGVVAYRYAGYRTADGAEVWTTSDAPSAPDQ
jgi:hypothetical protein